MPLYVIRPPNPPVGTDWSAAVPGQYLYDITGITALLTTSAGNPATALDSSGTGSDLAYNNPDVGFGIAGYVTGDTMVQNLSLSTDFIASGTVDMSWIVGNDLFFNVWTDEVPPSGSGPPMVAFSGAASDLTFDATHDALPAGHVALELNWRNTDTSVGFIAANGVYSAGRHMVSVRLDLGATGGQFYLDGVPFGAFSTFSGSPPDLDVTGTLSIGGKQNLNAPFPFYDEVAVGGNATVDADFANLYALRNNFAGYTAAQLGLGPQMYYHLDETGVGVGRQVTFEVTDGSSTVEEIPTGFAEVTIAGPFQYSWQPKLASSSQTQAGASTTVAIPRLLLPAGYTVGSRTLDLGANDQWSDIAIWWDSTEMDRRDGNYDYVFPPGYKLDYHYDPNANG